MFDSLSTVKFIFTIYIKKHFFDGLDIPIGCPRLETTHTNGYIIASQEHPWWRHQMEIFSALLALCAWNPPVIKGQWCRALMFSLNCAWINGWVNNREAGDLRRHRAHYDVIVMYKASVLLNQPYYTIIANISHHPGRILHHIIT